MRRPRWPATVLLAAAAAGCAAGGPDPAATTAPPQPAVGTARIAEVRAAREVVQGAVPGAAARATAVADALERTRTDDTTAARRAAVAAGLDLAALDEDAAALGDTTLDGEGPDVAAARAALGELAAAVAATAAAARAEQAELAALAAVDAELAELVATWDAAGQRSDRAAALDVTARAAARLAEEARGAQDVVPCVGSWERRAAAADTVAERSTELRDLVGGATGEEFDARRDRWRADPYALGGRIPGVLDAAPTTCWRDAAPTAAAVADVAGAVAALEDALQPDDL